MHLLARSVATSQGRSLAPVVVLLEPPVPVVPIEPPLPLLPIDPLVPVLPIGPPLPVFPIEPPVPAAALEPSLPVAPPDEPLVPPAALLIALAPPVPLKVGRPRLSAILPTHPPRSTAGASIAVNRVTQDPGCVILSSPAGVVGEMYPSPGRIRQVRNRMPWERQIGAALSRNPFVGAQ
jgi:hypothetical protein